MSSTPLPLGPTIANEFQDATVVRVYRDRASIAHAEKSMRVRMSYVDPSFLQAFSFPMLMGDPSTALSATRSIVITENVATRLFADANPVGKVLTLNEKEVYTVTGIVSRLPDNSSIVFDCLLPCDAAGRFLNSWEFLVATTFVLLPDYLEPRSVSERLTKIVHRKLGQEKISTISLLLQPFKEMHNDRHTLGVERSTDPAYIYIFFGIVVTVITISSVNYSAMAIGRAFLRTKEAGVRRLFGAQRHQLVNLYLVESVLLALMALIIALGLMAATLPSFNALVGRKISLFGHLNVSTSLYVLLLTVAIGVVAGIYPALALSRLQPIEVLCARPKSVNLGFLMRLLLVLQFAMSMVLIMGTVAMVAQLNLLINKNPGFRTDGVIEVGIGRLLETSPALVDVYERNLALYPNIAGVARGSHPLSNRQTIAGFVEAEGRKVEHVENIAVNFGFLNTLGFKMLEGRDFSSLYSTDRNGVIINQALMRQFGWRSAKDKVVDWNGGHDAPIIGVVRDFHFRSFHRQVAPAVIFIEPEICRKLFVISISEEDWHTLGILRKEWHKIAPSQPFRARFLEDDLKNQYKDENKWLLAVQFSAILALGLACLGSFGLTSFTVAQRTKEVGIRKVFGTSVPRLMTLLSFDFIKIVILATIIAGPIAYFLFKEWLQNFVYRIDLNVPIIAGAVLTFAFVMLTVSCKTYKAATANPADTLRHE